MLSEFNLDDRKPDSEIIKKIFSENEKKKLLEGFIKLPKEFWGKLPYSKQIRYITMNNEFRSGGFVINGSLSVVDSLNGGKIKNGIKLQNTPFIKGSMTTSWFVDFDETSEIYVKLDSIEGLTLQKLEVIEEKLLKMETNIKKIVNILLKKDNNKI